MEFTEQELEDFMVQSEFITVNNKRILLIDSQVNLNGFRVDLMGVDNNNDIYLFELKKGKIDGNALSQLLNYIFYAKSYAKETNKKIYGVLVGTDIDKYTKNSLNILEDIYYLETRPVFEYDDFQFKSLVDKNSDTLKQNSELFNNICKRFNYYDHPCNKKGND